jgi:hypothetical protein
MSLAMVTMLLAKTSRREMMERQRRMLRAMKVMPEGRGGGRG